MNNDVEEDIDRGGEEQQQQQQLAAIESLDDYVRRYGIESANGKYVNFPNCKCTILLHNSPISSFHR